MMGGEAGGSAPRGQRSFVDDQRAAQGSWFDEHLPKSAGYAGAAYRLHPKDRLNNLAPTLQDAADRLFSADPVIQWHQHASHGLSSQACCLNFLLPFAQRPELLRRWIEHVTSDTVAQVLPIEPMRGGEDWFVTFEWIGDTDYLNEAKPETPRKRGANATAADAAVLYRDDAARTHLLLIEWKYTERYGAPLDPKGNDTRRNRYDAIYRQPNGPILANADVTLDDFFYEPFYQLLRQQMLAWHTERYNPAIDRARVLHLSPSGNRSLHQVTSPNLREIGRDAFEVFRTLLVNPQDFSSMTIEHAFAPLESWPEADWFPWLKARYVSLCGGGEPA
jgi:hypothetical protein